MDKKQKAQMYMDHLRGEGYVPELDSDGDVVFKLEGRTYIILIDEGDEEFFRIIYPNFWSIESADERIKVEKAALAATSDTKVAKIFPIRDDVWGSVEIFILPPENFKLIFARAMRALRAAVDTFVQKMREQG